MGELKKSIQKAIKRTNLPPYLLAAIAACAVMAIAVAISSIVVANRPPKIEFIPPAFEENAEIGTPVMADERGYSELYKEGMTFSAYMCGEIYQENSQVVVYFTNTESNNAWLKLRIMDEQGNILGESGLLKPGEYVRAVSLSEQVAAGTQIRIKIMGYEPETYNSIGSVLVKTELLSENDENEKVPSP